MIKFTKMHGLGNDFVVLDAVRQTIVPTAELVQKLADRHRGVGCDQVLLISKTNDPRADFGYRIFNADGSEIYQCGNGARCVGLFIQQEKLSHKKQICLQTQRDFLNVTCCENNTAQVDIAKPNFNPDCLPFITTEKNAPYHLRLGNRTISFYVVNVGNPHCVIRADEGSIQDLKEIGLLLNGHAAFPDGVNVGMMHCISRDSIALCVYERGAGMTQACGSGACAAVAVGIQQAWLNKSVSVKQAGGVLQVTWPSPDDRIQLRGPAARVFDGLWQSDTEAKR